MNGTMHEQAADWLHGLQETDDVAGVSLRSGKIVGKAQGATSRVPMVALASRLWQLLADPQASRARPLFERTEGDGPNWLLARLMSWMPCWLLGPIMRLAFVTNRLRAYPSLVPPIATPFTRVDPPHVTETIEACLAGGNGEAARITARGEIRLDLALNANRVHTVARRYWRRLGPLDQVPVSAGYLVLCGQPRLTWRSIQHNNGIRPINQRVIALADLRTAAGMEALLASATGSVPSRTASLPIQAALPFDLPEVTAESHIGKAVSVVASTPADATDRLLISSVIRPEAEEAGLAELRLLSIAVGLPPDYPPIAEATIQLWRMERVVQPSVHIMRREDGAGVTLQVRQPEPLSVGEAVVVALRFEGPSIMHCGGRAAVCLEFRYRTPLSGLRECRYADPTGRLVTAQTSTGIAIVPEGLTLRLTGDVELSGLLFTTDERVHDIVTVEDARFLPTMDFVRQLIDLLADRQYVVRRVLESHPFTLGHRRTASFTCDIHGRLEESMASPDVHIRIHRESVEGRTQRPPTQFEVTVVGKGKARTMEERERLQEVLKEICETIDEGIAEALSATTESAVPESEPPPAASDEAAPGHDRRTPRVPPFEAQDVVARFEAALDRLEGFMDACVTAISHLKRT